MRSGCVDSMVTKVLFRLLASSLQETTTNAAADAFIAAAADAADANDASLESDASPDTAAAAAGA